MDHKSDVLHECTLGFRFIVASVDTMTDWAFETFSSGLKECKKQLFIYRHEQEREFLNSTGIYLRHTYSVDSWINVCLNLPTEIPSRYRGFNCDLAKCFDNIPRQGNDGIRSRIPIGLRTVFREACPGRKLYIPLDSDHQPCYDARFRRSRPSPFGKAVRCIELDLDDFIKFFFFCLDFLLVGQGDQHYWQIHGIPMGNHASMEILDFFLIGYEGDWVDRVKAHYEHYPEHRDLVIFFAKLLEHYNRYADDTGGLSHPACINLFDPSTPRDSDSIYWIYPSTVI